MRKRIRASFTVEAALLYPFLLMITFLLVRTTVYQYAAVTERAAEFYDAIFTGKKLASSELLRLSDVAFDLFGK